MLGVNGQPQANPEGKIEPLQARELQVISVGFLNPGDKPVIWRGPMLHSIIRQFLGSVQWGTLDYLVVDLPPGTGDVALSLIQTVPLTGAVVVSTPSDVSLQDARKAIEMFRQMKVDIVGMVENMSYFVCPHCPARSRHLLPRRSGENRSSNSTCRSSALSRLDPRSSQSRRHRHPGSPGRRNLHPGQIPIRLHPPRGRAGRRN